MRGVAWCRPIFAASHMAVDQDGPMTAAARMPVVSPVFRTPVQPPSVLRHRTPRATRQIRGRCRHCSRYSTLEADLVSCATPLALVLWGRAHLAGSREHEGAPLEREPVCGSSPRSRPPSEWQVRPPAAFRARSRPTAREHQYRTRRRMGCALAWGPAAELCARRYVYRRDTRPGHSRSPSGDARTPLPRNTLHECRG